MSRVVLPGETIGIVGGGQLARMGALAARAMGYGVIVADPDPACPASVAADVVKARLDSPDEVAPLADQVRVVTYEFENINPAVLERLAEHVPVHPGVRVLRASQHRILEKTALSEMGVPVAPWRPVRSAEEFRAAVAAVGVPSVLKTATMGYDGKGQVVIRRAEEAETAYERLAEAGPLVLEGFVPFTMEVSVVVARNAAGEVRTFPVAENIHRNNILDVSIVPARVAPETAARAEALARRVAERLEAVGLLAVEMFVLPDGSLLVNELAPRPHNSGHYTMDACVTSQFEQHIRAVAGLPLGAVDLLSPVVMVNLMGEHFPLDVPAALTDPHVKLHLYGKREARPARKMGHLNVLAPSVDEALERARAAMRRISTFVG